MKLTYDFHIHTALSPCGDLEMTPNNIVNMALLSGLDVIAITDHNTCDNVAAVLEVARQTDLLVVPSMEVETKEEIHVLCLFPSLDDTYRVQREIFERLPSLKNSEKIFGEQRLLNARDEVIGQQDRLLTVATEISLEELQKLVLSNKGAFIPAHIDRPSYSILSNLGMIPTNMEIKALEISRHVNFEEYEKKYRDYLLLQSSDSHELGFIGICNRQIEVGERTIHSIIKALNRSS